ncbi:hypothetical protein [Streptomyces cinereoruber]|uniref:hypothetical protein n=1 Tax=Streptomyces cinereoruber TaxID=67260 RepID=UPI003641E748
MADSANWKCADCDSNNGPKDPVCAICGSDRRAPMPRPAAPSRPAAERPSPARPTGDWQCGVCRATNSARNLSCVGCGKSWKTSSGPAPKKTATTKKAPDGKKPASGAGVPKKTTVSKKTTASKSVPLKPAASGAASRPRPAKKATPRKTAPPRPTGVFYPPTGGTGYTPTPPRTAAPPPYAPPVHTPPPRGPYRASAKKSHGCLYSCLGVAGGLVLLGIVQSLVVGALDSGGPDDGKPTARPTATGTACPSRIASALPSGEGAALVAAFRTDEHRITLCRTTAGKLYYYGEFRDGREEGIAMPAKKTSTGYEANNRPYRYVIRDGTVSIYKSGSRIGRKRLTPEPSPS